MESIEGDGTGTKEPETKNWKQVIGNKGDRPAKEFSEITGGRSVWLWVRKTKRIGVKVNRQSLLRHFENLKTSWAAA
jgi:hypothetical protein